MLAQKILMGVKKGESARYLNHPQMERFKKHKNPLGALATYLFYVWKEDVWGAYGFDKDRIKGVLIEERMEVTSGQLEYEFKHLKKKLKIRDAEKYKELLTIKEIEANPFLVVKKGPVASWEKS